MKPLITITSVSMLLLMAASVFSCKIATHDDLPPNVPKGYVEFYSEGVFELDGFATWYVCKLLDGEEKRYDLVIWDGNTKRRIAERPGMHTFMVKMGSAAQKVTVEIKDGMIQPVRVILKEGETKHAYKSKTIYFDMSLSVEEAVPFSE